MTGLAEPFARLSSGKMYPVHFLADVHTFCAAITDHFLTYSVDRQLGILDGDPSCSFQRSVRKLRTVTGSCHKPLSSGPGWDRTSDLGCVCAVLLRMPETCRHG